MEIVARDRESGWISCRKAGRSHPKLTVRPRWDFGKVVNPTGFPKQRHGARVSVGNADSQAAENERFSPACDVKLPNVTLGAGSLVGPEDALAVFQSEQTISKRRPIGIRKGQGWAPESYSSAWFGSIQSGGLPLDLFAVGCRQPALADETVHGFRNVGGVSRWGTIERFQLRPAKRLQAQ